MFYIKGEVLTVIIPLSNNNYSMLSHQQTVNTADKIFASFPNPHKTFLSRPFSTFPETARERMDCNVNIILTSFHTGLSSLSIALVFFFSPVAFTQSGKMIKTWNLRFYMYPSYN